jgi:hypothetical protein
MLIYSDEAGFGQAGESLDDEERVAAAGGVKLPRNASLHGVIKGRHRYDHAGYVIGAQWCEPDLNGTDEIRSR